MPHSFDIREVSRTWLATLYIRYFGLRKIPMVFFVRPSVVAWSEDRLELRIPLLRRTKNHLGGMYFAVLAAGADLAAGFQAMAAIRASGRKVSLIFKTMQADFLKRAEGDVHFVCTEGELIRDLVEKAVETGERVELPVTVVATVPKRFGDEPVARFTLTLSLKQKAASERDAPGLANRAQTLLRELPAQAAGAATLLAGGWSVLRDALRTSRTRGAGDDAAKGGDAG